MYSNWNTNENKDNDIPDYKQRICWHKVWHQLFSDIVNLVTCAHKDEGGEEHVDDRVVGDQDKNTMGVGTKPDMILGNEQLYVKLAKPGKKAGISRPDKPR